VNQRTAKLKSAYLESGPPGSSTPPLDVRAKAAVSIAGPPERGLATAERNRRNRRADGTVPGRKKESSAPAAYLNMRYPVGSAGRSQLRPASAITETRLATTTNTKAVAAIVVIGPRTLLSSSQVDAMRKTALAAI
jgi:hypothetical protein